MDYRIEQDDIEARVYLSGRLTFNDHGKVRTMIQEMVQNRAPRQILVIGGLEFVDIPGSPENPKIPWRYDAKVIGHTIAKRAPPAGHIAAQETEHGVAEAVVSGVTSVVGHVLVHQPPETLDRVQMRAVGRNEMEPDPPARHGQPILNRPGVMVAG